MILSIRSEFYQIRTSHFSLEGVVRLTHRWLDSNYDDWPLTCAVLVITRNSYSVNDCSPVTLVFLIVYWIRVMRRVAVVHQCSNSLEWWAMPVQLIAQDSSVRFWRLVPLHVYSFASRKWCHSGCRLKVWKRRSCHDSCHITSTTPSISARFHRKVIHSIRHESAYTARENNTSAMNNLNWASTTCRNQPILNDTPVRWTGKLPWRGYISRKNIGNAGWGNTAGSILKGPIHSSVVQTSRITRFRVGNDVVVIHGICGQWHVV